MLLSYSEIEEQFSDFGMSYLLTTWKNDFIDSGLILETDSEILQLCLRQFDFQSNTFHQFYYVYNVLAQSDYRKTWTLDKWL